MTRRRKEMKLKYVILGLTLLGGLWSCALDADHIWYWILHVPDPLNYSGIQGRPFHTVAWFLLFSVLAALVAGYLQPRIIHRRLTS